MHQRHSSTCDKQKEILLFGESSAQARLGGLGAARATSFGPLNVAIFILAGAIQNARA
jgi:hypothetical protein